ncbi:MAG: hypothetical protein QM610_03025 [Chitinophagaceae bacterium]
MFKYISLFVFFYILYQFVFKLVLPLFRATSVMQQRVNRMNEARQQYESHLHQQPHSHTPSPQKVKEREGEYIDFEEVS